jgi:hypothetical protein
VRKWLVCVQLLKRQDRHVRFIECNSLHELYELDAIASNQCTKHTKQDTLVTTSHTPEEAGVSFYK